MFFLLNMEFWKEFIIRKKPLGFVNNTNIVGNINVVLQHLFVNFNIQSPFCISDIYRYDGSTFS